VKVSEVFQVETPCVPGSLASVLLPDPLDLTIRERVSRALQTAIIGAAYGTVPTDTQPADEPPKVSGPQSGAP
jgi:hypothetical protein